MSDQLTHEAFARCLNTLFGVHYTPDHKLAFELVRVSDRQTSAHDESFSVLFRGPSLPLLPQAIYPFDHGEMGTFELFIVPVQRDANGLYYEAVFNYLLPRQ